MNDSLIRVLLVDDSEDDYIVTHELLRDVQSPRFELDWVSTYEEALATIADRQHDVYLLDYQIGARNGLEILQQMIDGGYDAPIIMLTGSSARILDLEAMQLGATDFLSKDEIGGGQLERTLRYAIRQRQLYQQVKHQAQWEQAFNHIVCAIRHSLDLTTTFAAATSELADLLEADYVGIVRYFPDQERWRHVAEHRRNLALPDALGLEYFSKHIETSTQRSPFKVIQHKVANSLEHSSAPTDVQPFPGDWLLIPLHCGETIWGNLCLLREAQGASWQDWEVKLMRAIAIQLAIAIQQSELYEQVQQLNLTLEHEKELTQVTLQSIGDAVITTDAMGRIQYLNPVAEVLTGRKQVEVQGLLLVDVFQLFHATTREPVESPIVEALREKRITKLAKNTVLITRSGAELSIDDSAAPIRTRNGQIVGGVMVFQDVSHHRRLADQLSWQASHDALTGLVNRRAFETHLEESLTAAKEQAKTHILLYLDLDNFKIVNDSCGHLAGDQLLCQIASLLQAHTRTTDVVARLGGDEFGVLLKQCPLEQALRIANLIREQIQVFRFGWEDKIFRIGVSIGLASLATETKSVADALSAADTACYAAKHSGRNRVHVHRANDVDVSQQKHQMQWVTRLSQALEDDRFCLYCQSIVPTTSTPLGNPHYEILLRLQDEANALISPGVFMPAAERYHLMHLIDRWVIRTLFTALDQHFHAEHACNCTYSVNLSGASINDNEFIHFVSDQFEQHQVPPSHICFEITETIAISNLTKAVQLIDHFRNLGCRFALDDFGSGMSSFAYLKNLPVDFLKIDGGFVKNIVNDPIDSAMVKAIHQIGRTMGLETVAEFVENDAILEKVTALGISYAQGYGIDKPHPLSATLFNQAAQHKTECA